MFRRADVLLGLSHRIPSADDEVRLLTGSMLMPPTEVTYDALRRAWETVCEPPIPEWTRALAAMQAEQARLVEAGAWVRGPHDLLTLIGQERRETYHSAMLAWLLDPMAAHGLGTRTLRSLLAIVDARPERELASPWAIRTRCEVARAHSRADIVVEAPGLRVVVENKVDAPEGDRQCDRLHEDFQEDRREVLFIFLTPTGRRPTSATGAAADAFRAVSYRALLQALERHLDPEGYLDPEGPAAQRVGRATALNYLHTVKRQLL